MLRSDDTGKHVLGVQDLLQKHLLMESQLSALSTRIRNLNKRAQPFMKSLQPETQQLQKRLEPLNRDYEQSVLTRVYTVNQVVLCPNVLTAHLVLSQPTICFLKLSCSFFLGDPATQPEGNILQLSR